MGGKYGAVVGLKQPMAWKFVPGTKKIRFPTYHNAVVPPFIKRRNFAKRQCERQWLTLPSYKYRSFPLVERHVTSPSFHPRP
jgi:hypothetical protein